MPPTEQENPQTSNAPNSSAEASSAPPTGASDAALEKTGFKWGLEAPPELQGKSPQQTLDQYQQLASAVRQYVTQNLQAQPKPAALPPQRIPQPMATNKEISDLWFNEPEKAQQLLSAQIQQNIGGQVGAALAPLYGAQADTARALARSADPEVWTKYGAEIEQVVAAVPLAAKTNSELWRQAARIVKANHLDEIVQERASTIASAAGGGLETGGTSGAAPGRSSNAVIEKLKESKYGSDFLARHGEAGAMQKLRDLERADGTSPMKFAEMAAKTNITADGPGAWKNDAWKVSRQNRDVARDVTNNG